MPRNMEYVLDTSAVMAYLLDEPQANEVYALRKKSALPFIVITELIYNLIRRIGQTRTDELMQSIMAWEMPLLFADYRICSQAGILKAGWSLGIADSYIAAFALEHSATLITKDPDYKVLEPQLKLLKF